MKRVFQSHSTHLSGLLNEIINKNYNKVNYKHYFQLHLMIVIIIMIMEC